MSDTFKAATWNVFYGSDLDKIEPLLRRLLNDGVTVFLFQEASMKGFDTMLRRNGLRLYRHDPQYVVAWKPEAWVEVRSYGLRLAATHYFRKDGKTPVWTEAAVSILSDLDGRTLTALSYHTPAGVQRGGPSAAVPRRVQALREAMVTMKNLAASAKTRAVLFGGDDNVDESRGHGWEFMLRAATGLRQVTAPRGTHGKRKIDDFRVKGVKPVGKGRVIENVSDHDVFVQKFEWR